MGEFSENCFAAPQKGVWCALTVTTGWETKTVERINSHGFIAVCPTYQKKYRVRGRAPNKFALRFDPLFSGYLFLQRDPNFRKQKFETTRVHLSFVRGRYLTDEEMTEINLLAMDLTSATHASPYSLPIKRSDILQIIQGERIGDRVKAIKVLRHQIEIEFLDRPEWKGRPVWINRTALGKAI